MGLANWNGMNRNLRYGEDGTGEVIDRRQVKREKVYVNGVDVSVLISREMYFDNAGKPITVSLKDHTKEIIQKNFVTLNDFLGRWKEADRKTAIIKELGRARCDGRSITGCCE